VPERLPDVVVGPQLQAAHPRILVVLDGQHDAGNPLGLTDLAQDLKAGKIRQVHVQEGQIRELFANPLQTFQPGGGPGDDEARILQRRSDQIQDMGFVLHHDDAASAKIVCVHVSSLGKVK
jgi:hypothetical protein